MADATAHIGVLSLELRLPDVQSLKGKRRVLKSLKDRIRGDFNVSVSEIGHLDAWQKAAFGICAIGNDKPYLDQNLQRILSWIDTVGEIQILDHEIHFF